AGGPNTSSCSCPRNNTSRSSSARSESFRRARRPARSRWMRYWSRCKRPGRATSHHSTSHRRSLAYDNACPVLSCDIWSIVTLRGVWAMNPIQFLRSTSTAASLAVMAFAALDLVSAAPVSAAVSLNGQVLGGGSPIASSTVTLWAATAGAPAQLGQARTGADGRFTIAAAADPASDATLYLVAKGGTPPISNAGGA